MKIEQQLEQFVEYFMPEDFQWRKGQKEAVISIIEAHDAGTKAVILDAPVGSGKSIIGLAVSWILNERVKEGYILASDIALQEQYEKDFKRLRMRWGSVKGIDNYMCTDNLEKNSLGTCRIRNKRPRSMYCYSECPYFSARDRAAETQTSLLNYAYWLIMQNYTNRHMDEDEQLFPARDFTICDEAHKILDIVQNHYSPRFDPKLLEKLDKLTSFFKTYNIRNLKTHFQSIKVIQKQLFEIENQDKLFSLLKELEDYIEDYLPAIQTFKDVVEEEYPKDDPPKEWREYLRISDWLKDFHCKIEDYNEIIDQTSTRNIIKNPVGEEEVVFNCLEENFMMNKYFHSHTGFTILMSATFADPRDYLRSIALSGAKYIKVESSFDFSKSPIYFWNKRRMSYKQMEANLPWLYEKINEIIENHDGENGIIHTASYTLTMKIHQNLTPKNRRRVLIYEGTEEKRKVLSMLKSDNSKILMGPSLLEGLDLRDEWSRFQIFAKVPYLSLGDRFVKAKMTLNPEWYRWVAIKNVLQGTGRSVRNEDDWAVTYFLDASLVDLLHKNRRAFPIEFIQRLQLKE